MQKIGIILTSLLFLVICSRANAAADPNTNAWQQAIQLQEQNSDSSYQSPHLATMTQHVAAVKDPATTAQPRTAAVKNSTTTTQPAGATATVQVSAKPTTPTRTKAVTIKPPENQPQPESHLWNLKNVDILKVIAEVSRETGKNFIVDPQVSGNVTIVSSTPLSSQEIYQVFLSTLHVLGFATVPTGNAIKIIPLRDAGRESNSVMTDHTTTGDNIVVQVIPLHYVSAIQLVPILNPLIPTWASVAAVITANSLIISGTAAIVDRVKQIVARVDTPAANGVDVVPLEYASAEDTVKEINKLIDSSRAYGDSVNAAVSADDRSNSVMIAGNSSTRLRLKVLISQLDQSSSDGLGDTQVIHLHYIQIQDILPILRGIARQNISSTGINSLMPLNNSSYGSSGSSGSNGISGGLTSNFTNQVQLITNSQLNTGAVTNNPNGTEQPTVITGDVTNNALIITAPTAVMNKLKNVISHLDVRPQQILVQGIIAEVDASKVQNLGITWGTNAPSANAAALGSAVAFPATGGLGVGFLQNGDLSTLIQLLATDSGSNILSTPSITVLNNGHADIEVGGTYSEISGQYQPQGNTPQNPLTQYQDKAVGLTLQVTPQITGDDSLRLAIDQTNSSLIPNSSNSANPNPQTNQEKISTSVLVNDGQILVLGGLINSQKQKTTTKVPILGDIPLLGQLFRSTEDSDVKKDLLVFLRPIVITTAEQAQEISKRRYEFMRDREILNNHDITNFAASSTLMSPGGVQLPVPFSTPTS